MFLAMKWLAALKHWAAEYPKGKSVNGLVSASLLGKTECANRAEAETV